MTSNITGTMVLMAGLLYSCFSIGVDTPRVLPDVASSSVANRAVAEFVRTAVEGNPGVQAAHFAVTASMALESASTRALYNPELELGFEDTEVTTRTIGLSQSIDWRDKRSARSALARAERLSVEAEYLLVRQAITLELLGGLAAYQTGLERKALATERSRLLEEFVELAKQRFDQGDISQVEYHLATLTFADASMKRATAATDFADGRQQVNNLVAYGSPVQWPMLDTQLPMLSTSGSTQSLLLALPEVQAAQRKVEAARAVVALRKREKHLDPGISLTAGEEGGETLLGVTLSIPLPIRNNFSDEVRAANELLHQAQQSADDVLRRAHARLINAAERYQIAFSAWQDWQRFGQPSLQQHSQLLRQLWQLNELSTVEYLVQINQSLDSQDSALDLRQALWRAWFEHLGASGQVEQWLGNSK